MHDLDRHDLCSVKICGGLARPCLLNAMAGISPFRRWSCVQRQLRSRDAELTKAAEDAKEQLAKAASLSTARTAEIEADRQALLRRLEAAQAEHQKAAQVHIFHVLISRTYYHQGCQHIADRIAVNAASN